MAPELNERSLSIAKALLDCARDNDFFEGDSLSVIKEIVGGEKALFIAMMKQTQNYLTAKERSELTAEEVVSLFNFVCAKAAEAVSAYFSGDMDLKFDSSGMFNGRAAVFADPELLEYFRDVDFPGLAATAFYNHLSEESVSEAGKGSALTDLFDALRWCYRIAVSAAVDFFDRR